MRMAVWQAVSLVICMVVVWGGKEVQGNLEAAGADLLANSGATDVGNKLQEAGEVQPNHDPQPPSLELKDSSQSEIPLPSDTDQGEAIGTGSQLERGQASEVSNVLDNSPILAGVPNKAEGLLSSSNSIEEEWSDQTEENNPQTKQASEKADDLDSNSSKEKGANNSLFKFFKSLFSNSETEDGKDTEDEVQRTPEDDGSDSQHVLNGLSAESNIGVLGQLSSISPWSDLNAESESNIGVDGKDTKGGLQSTSDNDDSNSHNVFNGLPAESNIGVLSQLSSISPWSNLNAESKSNIGEDGKDMEVGLQSTSNNDGSNYHSSAESNIGVLGQLSNLSPQSDLNAEAENGQESKEHLPTSPGDGDSRLWNTVSSHFDTNRGGIGVLGGLSAPFDLVKPESEHQTETSENQADAGGMNGMPASPENVVSNQGTDSSDGAGKEAASSELSGVLSGSIDPNAEANPMEEPKNVLEGADASSLQPKQDNKPDLLIGETGEEFDEDDDEEEEDDDNEEDKDEEGDDIPWETNPFNENKQTQDAEEQLRKWPEEQKEEEEEEKEEEYENEENIPWEINPFPKDAPKQTEDAEEQLRKWPVEQKEEEEEEKEEEYEKEEEEDEENIPWEINPFPKDAPKQTEDKEAGDTKSALEKLFSDNTDDDDDDDDFDNYDEDDDNDDDDDWWYYNSDDDGGRNEDGTAPPSTWASSSVSLPRPIDAVKEGEGAEVEMPKTEAPGYKEGVVEMADMLKKKNQSIHAPKESILLYTALVVVLLVGVVLFTFWKNTSRNVRSRSQTLPTVSSGEEGKRLLDHPFV